MNNNQIDAIRKVLTQNRDVADAAERHGVLPVDVSRVCERALAFEQLVATIDCVRRCLDTLEVRFGIADVSIEQAQALVKEILKREEVKW